MMRCDIDVLLDYEVPAPCTLLMQIAAHQGVGQTILEESLELAPRAARSTQPGDDGIGTRVWIEAADSFVVRYHARTEVTRPAPMLATLGADPLHAIPPEVTPYLMSSRYCFADALADFLPQFGPVTGGALIAAGVDWCQSNLTYDIFATTPGTDALDTLAAGRGVCRDFAHLLITMARSSAIPARLASVYAPDVDPPDFHAVAQVWLEGAWHLVDPTGMTRADRMALIGVGRDAADVAFLTAFGAITLKNQSVCATEVR